MLKSLQVENLRNLQGVSIQLSPVINLFYGENGSGKTSLLEAVNFIGLGRSFRSIRPKPIICYGQSELTCFAAVTQQDIDHRVGVSKSIQGDTQLRVDGKTLASAAGLAEITPLLSMNAASFELISGAAKQRRQILDWLAFHVEPLFIEQWRKAQYCLKQRNNLLRRDKIDRFELVPWDTQFQVVAEQIHQLRAHTFALLSEKLDNLYDQFSDQNIKIDYRPGWDTKTPLTEILDDAFEKDRERGYTYYGPQRADLHITVNGHKAIDVLSRGQQKILVCALIVALGHAFSDQKHCQCVFLVDDLPAELDKPHQQLLGKWLAEKGSQVLITGVERAALEQMWPESLKEQIKVFHVEQGSVKSITS